MFGDQLEEEFGQVIYAMQDESVNCRFDRV